MESGLQQSPGRAKSRRLPELNTVVYVSHPMLSKENARSMLESNATDTSGHDLQRVSLFMSAIVFHESESRDGNNSLGRCDGM